MRNCVLAAVALSCVLASAGCAHTPSDAARAQPPEGNAPVPKRPPKKIGLALGGGAARGFAEWLWGPLALGCPDSGLQIWQNGSFWARFALIDAQRPTGA